MPPRSLSLPYVVAVRWKGAFGSLVTRGHAGVDLFARGVRVRELGGPGQSSRNELYIQRHASPLSFLPFIVDVSRFLGR